MLEDSKNLGMMMALRMDWRLRGVEEA